MENFSLLQPAEIVGSANWEGANTEIKREEAGERKSATFSQTFRALHFRVISTVWEPGTG